MKLQKNIRELIRKVHLSASTGLDEKVRGEIAKVLEDSRTKSRAVIEPEIWRTIMKSKMTKLAAAAAIIIAALIGIYHFNGTIDGASVAWAEMQETFSAQPWVHIKYNTGRETWISLVDGSAFYKREDGALIFVNYAKNLRQEYRPELGEYISEATYSDKLPQWQPQSGWSYLISPLEKNLGRRISGPMGQGEIKKEVEDVNGNYLVRFDQYLYDLEGHKKLIAQIWADSKTRLPLKMKEEQENISTLIGLFDFPKTGPENIYDLGVAKDLPLIRLNTDVGPDIDKIFEAAKEAYAGFPTNYRAITWPMKGNREVDVVYRFGEMIRHEHYLCSIIASDRNKLTSHASSEEVLKWTLEQIPNQVEVFDGHKTYVRNNPRAASPSPEGFEPQERSISGKHLSIQSEPHNGFWPYVAYKTKLDWIADPQEELKSYIGLRDERGDTRRDYYIDPNHDYICVREIWWKLKLNSWIKEREWERSGFVQLPQGQWYPTKMIEHSFHQVGRSTDLNETSWNIDFKPLDKSEYSNDLFDGNKLFESN